MESIDLLGTKKINKEIQRLAKKILKGGQTQYTKVLLSNGATVLNTLEAKVTFKNTNDNSVSGLIEAKDFASLSKDCICYGGKITDKGMTMPLIQDETYDEFWKDSFGLDCNLAKMTISDIENLQNCEPCMARDESKPSMMSVSYKNGEYAATDSRRLVVIDGKKPVSSMPVPDQILFPYALVDMLGILKPAGDIELELWDMPVSEAEAKTAAEAKKEVVREPRYIVIRGSLKDGIGFEIIHRRLEGEFPDYAGFVKQDQQFSMMVTNKKKLTELLTQALKVASANANIIKIEFIAKEGLKKAFKMVVSATGDFVGSERIQYKQEHGEAGEGVLLLEISFNARYLLEAIKIIDSDSMLWEFHKPLHPMFISDKGIKFATMPIRPA